MGGRGGCKCTTTAYGPPSMRHRNCCHTWIYECSPALFSWYEPNYLAGKITQHLTQCEIIHDLSRDDRRMLLAQRPLATCCLYLITEWQFTGLSKVKDMLEHHWMDMGIIHFMWRCSSPFRDNLLTLDKLVNCHLAKSSKQQVCRYSQC